VKHDGRCKPLAALVAEARGVIEQAHWAVTRERVFANNRLTG
jgi:hypothetical protein